MSSNLVIVAIPDENDRVWKVSSEKIPHLTVLFLGETDSVQNLEQIMLFVEHAANTSLKRFYLPVDRRGELGDDKADVLFFKKGRYDYKAIREFRSMLLQDQNIKTAYDSAEQFEGPWNPHLTLGYPETPAKSIPDEQTTFFDVSFNKIAVWTGDFEGPDWLLKDYWDEMDALECAPMDVAMSAITHATTVSDKPWSQFKDSDYDDSQYARACLLDRGKDAGTAKARYGIPVREPDGTLNRNACHAAASVLSSTGGTGSARGNKVKGSPEQLASAKNKLVALYKGPLNEDVPKGLGGEDSVKQTADLGSEFLSHYGKKGMKWGVRNVDSTGRTTEKKREGTLQKFLDPQGHDLSTDAAKTAIGVIAPVVAPLTIPAQIRLIRGGARGLKAKSQHNQEQRFAKNAHSAKNFVAIHNGAHDQINKHIADVNKKYPQDLTKDPKAQKQYDSEITKGMQNAYRTSANQLGNKKGTQHLDLEFHNDGLDFKIVAKEGAQTPTLERVVHAAADDTSVEFTGKIKRDATGHIVGLVFDDFEPQSMAQSVDLGLQFLEHHGVKGQKWGVRRSSVGGAAKSGAKAVGRGAKKTGKGLVTFAKDVGFETEASQKATTRAVVSTANKNFNKQDLPRINAKYKETKAGSLKGRLKNPLHADTLAYRSEARIAYRDRINETVANLPTNASKTRKYEIEDGGKTNTQYHWSLKVVDVKKTVAHADPINTNTSLGDFDVRPVFDSDGFIVDVKLVEDTLAQTIDFDQEFAQLAELGAEFLTHHGVKGMKWGQRNAQFQSNRHARRVSAEKAIREKRPAQEVKALDTIGTSKRKQSSISTKGGEDHPPTPEAISVAVQKQKIKKSGLSALSNNELQEVQRRLNLENDVKRLMVGDRTAGQKFIDGLLGRGSKEDRKMLENRAGQKAQEAVIKKVGKAAVGFV
jgi:2'-5' RNA ligase